jgi:hypothetical protein
MNSLVMIKHTHRIRTIQQINRKVINVRMKMVEVSATNILMVEWGFENEENK